MSINIRLGEHGTAFLKVHCQVNRRRKGKLKQSRRHARSSWKSYESHHWMENAEPLSLPLSLLRRVRTERHVIKTYDRDDCMHMALMTSVWTCYERSERVRRTRHAHVHCALNLKELEWLVYSSTYANENLIIIIREKLLRATSWHVYWIRTINLCSLSIDELSHSLNSYSCRLNFLSLEGNGDDERPSKSRHCVRARVPVKTHAHVNVYINTDDNHWYPLISSWYVILVAVMDVRMHIFQCRSRKQWQQSITDIVGSQMLLCVVQLNVHSSDLFSVCSACLDSFDFYASKGRHRGDCLTKWSFLVRSSSIYCWFNSSVGWHKTAFFVASHFVSNARLSYRTWGE